MDATAGDVLLLVADEWMTACEVLGQLRNDLGRPPVYEGPYRYVWVVDFPMFVGVSEDGRPKPAHHAFTHPHPDDIDKLETDPMSVRSQAYDLVLNGWELGSGSIRIHDPALQQRVFNLLGIDEEEANRRFGFFLTPFRYGAPPARRVRVRHGAARRHPRRRGEHPRDHRLPEDAVRPRPDDRRADAGRRTPAHRARPPRPSSARTDPPRRPDDGGPPNLRGWPEGDDLFHAAAAERLAARAPLADRLRPTRLDDIVGQPHLLGPVRRCGRSSRPTACRR